MFQKKVGLGFSPWPQTVTSDAVLLWAQRAIQDYEKKVPKGASSKQKAGCPNHFVH